MSAAVTSVSTEADTVATPAGTSAAAAGDIPHARPGYVWYLAYGSNMNPKVLTGRRKVHPLASLPAYLPGYALGFNLYGVPYLEPGMATVQPITTSQQTAAKAAVEALQAAQGTTGLPALLTAQDAYQARMALGGLHGIVHLISEDEWKIVKATEGVVLKNLGYQVITVTCELYDGRKVQALTLEAAPVSVGNPATFLPSQRYMGLIREGAKDIGINPEYLALLNAHPAYEPLEGLPGKLAKGALAGMAVAAALPLSGLVLTTAAARMASNVIWGSGSRVSQELSQSDSSAPGAMATTVKPTLSTPALQDATATQRAAAPNAPPPAPEAQSSAGGASQDRPGPIVKAYMTLRTHLDPRVMSVSMWLVFRWMWAVHDLLLGWLLGSGKDNKPGSSAAQGADKKHA